MDPIQEAIEIETDDAQAAVQALADQVRALQEELAGTKEELQGLKEGLDDTGDGADKVGGSLQGMARGGLGGLGSAIKVVNPELGGMIVMFAGLQAALPKLAGALRALPAALGPIGIAAIAAAAAFSALTYATRKTGEELDELDRKLERNARLQNQLAGATDNLKELQSDLMDEYMLLSGQITEAEAAQRDFNAEVDRNVALQLQSGLLTEQQAEAIRKRGETIKGLYESTRALREQEEAREEAARKQEEADLASAAALRTHQDAAEELTLTLKELTAQASARLEVMRPGTDPDAAAAEALARQQAANSVLAAFDAPSFSEQISGALAAAFTKARIRFPGLREAFIDASDGALQHLQGAAAILSNATNPLGLLSLAGPGGMAAGAALGGLAQLGTMSDEDLQAAFGGLADAILAGLEKLPEILGPLVVDFAFELIKNLPRALVEAIGGLFESLLAIIFPNRFKDDTPGTLTEEEKQNILDIQATNEERRIEQGDRGSPFRTSAVSLSGTDAAPALDAALGRRRRGRGAVSGVTTVRLTQPGIFSTTQSIDLATGPGGLRERQ